MKKITAALITTALILTGCGTPTESDSASQSVFEPAQVDVENWVKDAAGVPREESWTTSSEFAVSWAPYVSDTYWKSGNLWVNMQIDHDADKDIAESAAKLLANTAAVSDDEISQNMDYAIVADGTGRQIKQEKVNR